MSDGPHRSLPMSRGWKRVAERAANQAFVLEEISYALPQALEEDCHNEIAPDFLDDLRNVFQDHESSLFKEKMRPRLDDLRSTAGCGMGRIVLEHAAQVAERGGTGMDGLVEAATNALTDRAARGARSVEEHFYRKSSSPRAQKVRERIEQGIAGAAINGLARKILKVDPRPSSSPALKQRGLDDGVRL